MSTEQKSQPELDVLSPWGTAGPPGDDQWGADVLGGEFRARTIPLLPDDEGPVVATLTNLPAQAAPRGMILYLHGRNDYFFQTEMAKELSRMGLAFYALDLRKYGRSLRPWQTIGYVDDLSVHEEEIGRSVEIMQNEHPELPLFLMGHSTGGLIATLWAYRRPGVLAGLILNSAWLELQSLAAWRPALQQIFGRIAARNPHTPVVSNTKPDVYGASLTAGWRGSGLPLPIHLQDWAEDPAIVGWKIFPEWKRDPSYPVPAAWFEAILHAQNQVEQEVHIDCPVLSLCSTSSAPAAEWSPETFSADIVLDTEAIVRRSANLSDLVTIARLPGKHDLFLSDPPVRHRLYQLCETWLEAVLRADTSRRLTTDPD